jgi:neutral amino acid transport system ATP-binding protein
VTALLRTEGIHKSFGGVQALDACTVQIDEGTVAGLIGPNGSGKTTLFNVITGYAKADSGEVYLSGTKITNSAPDKVFALGIGRTFQLTRIFPSLTVMENMLVPCRGARAADRKRAMEQLEFVGIAGYHATPAGALSYGQRKLLELAYVLVADPAIILLDEPAGGVNLSLLNQIADRIRELNGAGKTFHLPTRCTAGTVDWTPAVAIDADAAEPARRQTGPRRRTTAIAGFAVIAWCAR